MISTKTINFDNFIEIKVQFVSADTMQPTSRNTSTIAVQNYLETNATLIQLYNPVFRVYPSYVIRTGRFFIDPYNNESMAQEETEEEEEEIEIADCPVPSNFIIID